MKKIIFCVLITFVFFFGVKTAYSQCSCRPKLTLQEHFQKADEVFTGKVVESRKTSQEENSDVKIKFEVKQTWKNDLEKTVLVIEPNGNTIGFESGKEWLLYAVRNEAGRLRITRGCCSRTKPLSVATQQGDFGGFKKMKIKPKKIIDESECETISNLMETLSQLQAKMFIRKVSFFN